MRRAARVDSNHSQIVRELEQCGCHVEDLSGVGAGCPDLLVASPSGHRMMLVEVKTVHGKLREAQELFFERWPEDTRMVARCADDVLQRLGMI